MLCDNLEGLDGVGGGREVQQGGNLCILYVYTLWLIHVGVWQKPIQHCDYYPPNKNKNIFF